MAVMEIMMNTRPLNRVRMTKLMMGVHAGLILSDPVPWWGGKDNSDLVVRNLDASAEIGGNDLVAHLPDDYQGDVRQDDADLVAVNW